MAQVVDLVLFSGAADLVQITEVVMGPDLVLGGQAVYVPLFPHLVERT